MERWEVFGKVWKWKVLDLTTLDRWIDGVPNCSTDALHIDEFFKFESAWNDIRWLSLGITEWTLDTSRLVPSLYFSILFFWILLANIGFWILNLTQFSNQIGFLLVAFLDVDQRWICPPLQGVYITTHGGFSFQPSKSVAWCSKSWQSHGKSCRMPLPPRDLIQSDSIAKHFSSKYLYASIEDIEALWSTLSLWLRRTFMWKTATAKACTGIMKAGSPWLGRTAGPRGRVRRVRWTAVIVTK